MKVKIEASKLMSELAVESLIRHIKRDVGLRECGGVMTGWIDVESWWRLCLKALKLKWLKGVVWRKVVLNINNYGLLENVSKLQRHYKPEKKELFKQLRRIYKEKRSEYIGGWHTHLSGNSATSSEDDLSMLNQLRWQKRVALSIVTKWKNAIGTDVYRVTTYLYFRKWFAKFKWKLEELDIIVPAEGGIKFVLNYAGTSEAFFKK